MIVLPPIDSRELFQLFQPADWRTVRRLAGFLVSSLPPSPAPAMNATAINATAAATAADELPGMTGAQFRQLMRAHRCTIRELARRAGVPMESVRRMRADGIGFLGSLDYWQAITGAQELDARRRAQFRQYRRLEWQKSEDRAAREGLKPLLFTC
ncbi:MAG: hypothetical protein NT069_15750 [Planctomycetota bacterium]|nr:hypothetical protein [Planctomycetota bacterium]